MKWYHYIIVIILTIIVVIIVDRILPPKTVDVIPEPGLVTTTTAAHHQWLYIDRIDGKPTLTDVDGDAIVNWVVTFKGDKLVFVNRTDELVDVGFTNENIFGASRSTFKIEPFKRQVREVIGPPNDYPFQLKHASGPVTAPKVKVGEEP